MNFLIDTHVFVWLDIQQNRLSKSFLNIFQDTNNQFYLSFVSIWEIQIKTQLGKLALSNSLSSVLVEQQKINRIHLLPMKLTHILGLSQLPNYHNDPFDRLLISQVQTENMTLITDDAKIRLYQIPIFW